MKRSEKNALLRRRAPMPSSHSKQPGTGQPGTRRPGKIRPTLLAMAITQTLMMPSAQAATILVDNTGDGIVFDTSCNLREAVASITAARNTAGCNNSIIQDGSCVTSALGVDPMLGPLTYNGGLTETHALLAGSPAIDGANPSLCPGCGSARRAPGCGRFNISGRCRQ